MHYATSRGSETMLERRVNSPEFNEHMNMLSDEQRIALHDLHGFGYDLAFVRTTDDGKQAFLRLGDSYAVIDHFGTIEMNPDTHIR